MSLRSKGTITTNSRQKPSDKHNTQAVIPYEAELPLFVCGTLYLRARVVQQRDSDTTIIPIHHKDNSKKHYNMKKIYAFLLSLFALLSLAIPTHGEDSVYKTALFGKNYNSASVQNYTSSWSATYNGFTVDLVNANNNQNGWSYIKLGSKSSASVGMITTHTPIDKPVTKVVLTIDAITSTSVNSITLLTSYDGKTYSSVGTFKSEKGEQSVFLSSPIAAQYYQIKVDCAKGSANGLVQISKVEYYVGNDFPSAQSYSVTWKVGGEVYTTGNPTTSVADGSKVTTLPTEPDVSEIGICADKFMGWSTSNLGSTAGQSAPDDLFKTAGASPVITAPTTFYAVFAKAGTIGGGSVTDSYDWESTETGNWIVDAAITRTASQGVNGGYAGKISTANTYVTYKNKVEVTSFSFDFKRTTNNGNYNVYIETSEDNKTWATAATFAMSSFNNGSYGTTTKHSFDGAKELYVRFHCYQTTATRYVDNVSITYGGSSTTYTDYVTECVQCTNDLGVTWGTMNAADVVRQTATLSWNLSATNSGHIAGYSVHVWSTGSTVYNKTFTVSGAATKTLALTDLVRETDYAWTVTALTDNPAWCTATSGQQTFKTKGAEKLPAPGNPKVVYNQETDNYTFSWDAVPNATKYTMSGQFSGDISNTNTSSTRALSGVIPGTTYTVTVTAKGDNGVNYIDSDPASYTFTAHTYTLTLSVTDNNKTDIIVQIDTSKYTLPTATSMCEASEGWTFAGWSETDITDESTTTAPTLIVAGTVYAPDNGYIKSDRTLYAVFSKVDEETVSDTYKQVTAKDDVTNGNYMIVGLGASSTYYALTSTPATTSGWFNGNKLGKLANAYSTTDPTQIWEIKKEGTNYLIYNAAKKQYLNINSSTLVMEDAGIPYTLSVAYAGNVSFKSTKNTSYYLASHTGENGIFNAYTQANTVYLYKNATTCIYTTAPSCVDCTQEGADCPEYPLVLNDRGQLTQSEKMTYWVGEEIPKPEYTPQGECAGYQFEGWTTEAGLSNLSAEEWASKEVTFPIKMPKSVSQKPENEQKLTLYAVYSSVWTDEYRLVTDMGEMTTGEYVITTAGSGAKENALSFVRADYIENFGSQSVDITKDEDGIDIVSTTNPEIIWTLTETEDGNYTLEALHFDGMEKRSYLNIVSNYLQFEETAKPYTISEGDTYAAFTLCSPDGYCMSYNGQDFVAGETATPLYLYKRVKDTRYSTSTACDPSIISVGTVAVTSAPGIWVEAVTQPYIFAERLNSNRDGAASVDIIATSKTAQFTLKAVGATGAGSASLTLKAGETRDNFADRFMVVYKPTRYNVIDEGTIEVKAVNAADHSKEYAVHTIHVKGRSLPEKFVIAAQTGNGWVALPADLGTSSLATLKAPYRITVDDDNDPATATQAPETAIYHAAARFDENTNPRGVHLMNGNGMRLCGDYSKEPDNRLWFAQGEVTNSQSWALRSLALKDYYIRLQAAPAGNYLFYNATTGGGKIGYYEYKQQNRLRLRLLPVGATCVRYDAPVVQVAQLKSEYVVLQWPVVEGMPGYEYSLDEGGTWKAFEHGTDWEDADGMNKGTITGLAAGTYYTVWVRVATPNGETNCSDYGIRSFTAPDCDDVPAGLWASATADAVTVIWNAESPTATVKIYSDKDKTNVVATQEGAKSPCKITGLEQNTTYWYQVFTGGTCASAVASFTTESNEVNIVEWEKEAVIVDINTEVTDADDVSIVVENRVEHGDKNQNVAEDLFFSKYYEASGDVKLVGIYNGTQETLSLADYGLYIGGYGDEQTWMYKITDLSVIAPKGVIAPAEEIILWRYTNNDAEQVECIKGKIDVSKMIENQSIIFSGRQAVVLTKNQKPIDVMGAVEAIASSTGEIIDELQPSQCKDEKPSWGDQSANQTWNGWGYSIEDPTQKIALSMNRCLLVRSKLVKSGKNAVEKNRGIAGFVTLGNEEGNDGEWLGRQVPGKGDEGRKNSCEGFSYVADFNYNDYYTTFEEISETELKSQRNPNGTYTIPVARLDTLACTDIRLQLKKGGEVIATREQKVPIIITATTATDDALFSANGLDETICSTCDVVVRDKATLAHAKQGVKQFRHMHIYHGSRLEIPEGTEMTLDKVRMFALNDTVSYAILNNTNTGTGITVKEVSHVKRIDGKYWYPFSLPYDCRIADIGVLNGGTLGTYGIDWGIKYYDGERRQKEGNSTTAPGEVSKYWTMMSRNGTLEANKGYIIGLFVPASEEAHQQSINFAPATIEPYTEGYTEGGDSKTAYAKNWPDNLEADARHHGWNFVGSPYISAFGVHGEGQGLYNTDLKMGYTDIYGDQQDMDNIYVTIPDGGNTNTYTQKFASGVDILPFTAYFVQTIDPTDNASHDIELTYSKGNLTLQSAPQRVQAYQSDILVEMTLSQGSLCDNAGVWVGNRYTAGYEIGRDLDKMYAAADKPQLYTLSGSGKMAYNAVSDQQAQHLPLGMYVPAAGDYTLSLNPYLSRTADAEAVYLLYDGSIAANLLTSDYRFTAAGKGNVEGYTLDIRRARSVTTGTESAEGGTTAVVVGNGQLTLLNLPADADVQVYDMLGRIWLATVTTGDTPQTTVPDLPTGVYTVVITTANAQQVIKTILR